MHDLSILCATLREVGRLCLLWRDFAHSLRTQLRSLPLDGRLWTLRSRSSASEPSQSALAGFLFLINAGLNVDYPTAGRPSVRGESGFAFRWGEGWFRPIRGGGVGWSFDPGAEAEVSKRTHILIRLFKRSRADAPLALDDQLLQIADVPAPVPVSVS